MRKLYADLIARSLDSHSMKNTGIHVLFLAGVLLLMAGCQMTQSAFTKTTGNAGASFAGAATTLTYAHAGKITTLYATSSFQNYQSGLDGLDQHLPSLQGVPDAKTLRQLLQIYKPAIHAVDHPCLATGCDWRAQVLSLTKASRAFLMAGGQ